MVPLLQMVTPYYNDLPQHLKLNDYLFIIYKSNDIISKSLNKIIWSINM